MTHDPMDSGEVRLGVMTSARMDDAEKRTLRYDCAWQIKPPYGEDALVTYLKLLDADLTDGT